MGMLCAVTLVDRGQLHYAEPGGLSLEVGDKVLLPADHGAVVGTVVWASEWVSDDTAGFPSVLGMATDADVVDQEDLRKIKARVIVATRKLARQHGLVMKVLAADPQVDTGRTVIYYSAPERVDFRAMLRDLAATLQVRVELRQLGDRDAVRAVGAIGSCGRETCCSSFLKDYEPITLAMAKDQDLPTNPLRISGVCGRLMCCLKFEHPLYQEFKKSAPRVGAAVDSPEGPGTVVAHSVPTDSVVLRMNADGSHQVCPRASVCSARKSYETRHTQ
ncbi:MAG: regulatory iron-sulfur-containing complex subunit RicT [Nakamurella sp.]